MQTGIEEVGYLFLLALMFFLCYFFRSFWRNKARLMLVAVLMVGTALSGCAAGQVMVASSEHESANCEGLNNELAVAQARLQKLDSTDTTERDIRNFLLGIGGFFIPPLAVINAALILTDSYAADYAETKTLQGSYNNMVMVSQRQGCGSAYALIPVEEESKEPKA